MVKKNYLVSVVIPAYNEENRIGNTIEKIINFFNARYINFELIIVDDCSKDNILGVINIYQKLYPENKFIILKNSKNKGKGFSIKKGMLCAKGDIVLFTDADLSTPIEEFEKLEYFLIEKNFDIAIGSRNIDKTLRKVPQGKLRGLMGNIFSYIVKIILLPNIFDSQCGFKLFKYNCIKPIFSQQTIDGFGFDPEILLIAIKNKYKIVEVPVVWNNDDMSKVNILKDPFIMMCNIFILKFKLLFKSKKEK